MVTVDGRPMIAIAIVTQKGRVGKNTYAINLSGGKLQEGQRALWVIRPVGNQSVRRGNEKEGENSGLCEEKTHGYGRGDYRGIGDKS
jgi:hypothetical protein